MSAHNFEQGFVPRRGWRGSRGDFRAQIERLEKALHEAFTIAEKLATAPDDMADDDLERVIDIANITNRALNPDARDGCFGCGRILVPLNGHELCEECVEHQFS